MPEKCEGDGKFYGKTLISALFYLPTVHKLKNAAVGPNYFCPFIRGIKTIINDTSRNVYRKNHLLLVTEVVV